MNENVNAARHDEKSGGTEIAFFAHDFTFPVAMQDHCALGPLSNSLLRQLGQYFLERRQILDQLINAQRFAGKFFNDLRHISSFCATAQRNTFSGSLMEELSCRRNQFLRRQVWNGLPLRFPLASRTWSEAFCVGCL